MLNKLRERAQSEKGFTLIELLVVILIIGILAAIALPAFLGQKARAQDTAGKSAVREAQTAIETWYTDHETYTGSSTTVLQDIEESLKSKPGDTLTVADQGDKTYTLTVTAKTGNAFTIKKLDTGAVQRTCTRVNSKGGCPSDGSW